MERDMTAEQEAERQAIQAQVNERSKRLQAVVDAMADAALDREFWHRMGFEHYDDDRAKIQAWRKTLAELKELDSKQEQLLTMAGILKGQKQAED
jgi:phenylalanyl-tRNA synthetase alpha subunit